MIVATCLRRPTLRLASVVSPFVVLAFPTAAHADDAPEKPSLVSVSAGIAAARFAVDTGSSPPCCGERAAWTTVGPELQARVMFRLTSWLRPGLEGGVSFLGGEDRSLGGAKYSIEQRVLRLTPMVVFHLGQRLFVEPRVAYHLANIVGRYERVATSLRDTDETYKGPSVGLAAGFHVTPRWAAGVDGSLALLGDFGPLGLSTYSTGGGFVRFVP